MNSDSPSPAWYEPRDLIELDDQAPEPEPAEPLVIAHGIVSWSLIDSDD